MKQEKVFYGAADISNMLEISKTTAYKIIRQVNDEMKAAGYITISGKVNKKYFDEKVYSGKD